MFEHEEIDMKVWRLIAEDKLPIKLDSIRLALGIPSRVIDKSLQRLRKALKRIKYVFAASPRPAGWISFVPFSMEKSKPLATKSNGTESSQCP